MHTIKEIDIHVCLHGRFGKFQITFSEKKLLRGYERIHNYSRRISDATSQFIKDILIFREMKEKN